MLLYILSGLSLPLMICNQVM